MNALPSISGQIDEKIIVKTLKKNKTYLDQYYITLINNRLISTYKNYNDM